MGESIVCTAPGNEPRTVDLQHVDERAAIVRVDGAEIPISLGHFASRSLGNPADDVVSMVTREGLRIGADMTRDYMSGSEYSLSLVNLKKDARIYLGPADAPLSGPGSYCFPVPDYDGTSARTGSTRWSMAGIWGLTWMANAVTPWQP